MTIFKIHVLLCSKTKSKKPFDQDRIEPAKENTNQTSPLMSFCEDLLLYPQDDQSVESFLKDRTALINKYRDLRLFSQEQYQGFWSKNLNERKTFSNSNRKLLTCHLSNVDFDGTSDMSPDNTTAIDDIKSSIVKLWSLLDLKGSVLNELKAYVHEFVQIKVLPYASYMMDKEKKFSNVQQSPNKYLLFKFIKRWNDKNPLHISKSINNRFSLLAKEINEIFTKHQDHKKKQSSIQIEGFWVAVKGIRIIEPDHVDKCKNIKDLEKLYNLNNSDYCSQNQQSKNKPSKHNQQGCLNEKTAKTITTMPNVRRSLYSDDSSTSSADSDADEDCISEELDDFFVMVSRDAVCSEKVKRKEALKFLSDDWSIKFLYGRHIRFIVKGLLENDGKYEIIERYIEYANAFFSNKRCRFEKYATYILFSMFYVLFKEFQLDEVELDNEEKEKLNESLNDKENDKENEIEKNDFVDDKASLQKSPKTIQPKVKKFDGKVESQLLAFLKVKRSLAKTIDRIRLHLDNNNNGSATLDICGECHRRILNDDTTFEAIYGIIACIEEMGPIPVWTELMSSLGLLYQKLVVECATDEKDRFLQRACIDALLNAIATSVHWRLRSVQYNYPISDYEFEMTKTIKTLQLTDKLSNILDEKYGTVVEREIEDNESIKMND